MVVFWRSRGRQRPFTRRSDTIDADEAESSKALAFTVESSGALTRTLQVISSDFRVRLAAVFDKTSEALGSGLGETLGPGVLLIWRRVWCGF